jgi:hypothetical protein
MKRKTEEQIIEHLRSARELCYQLELKAIEEGDRATHDRLDGYYKAINSIVVDINNHIDKNE